jgi:hypothetical protein
MKAISKIILGIIALVAIGFLFNENTTGFLCIVEKMSAIVVLAGCALGYLALDKGNKTDYSNEYFN